MPIRQVKYDTWAAQELPEFLRLLNEAAEYRDNRNNGSPSPIVASVSQLIRDGIRSEQIVARWLGMSTATLRRRLADEGSSFRMILSDERREIVRQLLMTDKALSTVTEEAGYSDDRSLRRACVRWFGQSPERYREALRQNMVGGRVVD